jgi:hypothetical protein
MTAVSLMRNDCRESTGKVIAGVGFEPTTSGP